MVDETVIPAFTSPNDFSNLSAVLAAPMNPPITPSIAARAIFKPGTALPVANTPFTKALRPPPAPFAAVWVLLSPVCKPLRSVLSAPFNAPPNAPFIPPLAARPALADPTPAFTVPTPLTPFCTVPNVIDPPLNPFVKDLKNPSPADLACVNPFVKASNMPFDFEVIVLAAEIPEDFKEPMAVAPLVLKVSTTFPPTLAIEDKELDKALLALVATCNDFV